MVSNGFGALWKNLGAITMERKWSDHLPIMLSDKWADFGHSPFKFFDAWLKVESLEEVVKEAWSKEVTSFRPDCKFRDKLKNVKNSLRGWCKEKWGEVDKDLATKKKEVKKWEAKIELSILEEDERRRWIDARKEWLTLEEKSLAMAK